MFVDLPEGRSFVDTGCPTTFGIRGHVTWDGVRRTVHQEFGPVSMREIQSHVETTFAGLIGLDFLNAQDSCGDGPDEELRLGDANVPAAASTVELEDLMGEPVVQASLGAHAARCIFNIGAQFGYDLNEQLTESDVPDGRIDDFNPIFGAIESLAWRVEVGLGTARFTERVGLLPRSASEILKVFAMDAVIGCSWIPSRTIWYQPTLRRIAISSSPRELP